MIDYTEKEIMASWDTDKYSGPMVSVRTTAYNQEKYIAQALDSLLMQKTTFPFEIVVHDDASTDNTASLILDYKKRFPNIINAIIEAENQYSKGNGILRGIMDNACRGKYWAYCEGDDFWTDPLKLQKQFNVMEENQDLSMCCHTVIQVNKDGKDNGERYPAKPLNGPLIDLQKYLDYWGYPFQTSCFFARADLVMEYGNSDLEFRKCINIGDRPLCMYLLTRGPIFFIKDEMSCYRRFSENSWSAKTYGNKKKRILYLKSLIKMMENFDDYTGHRYDCHIGSYKWDLKNYRAQVNPFLGALAKMRDSLIRTYGKMRERFPFISVVVKKLLKRGNS